MKKRLQGIVVGIVIGVAAASGIAYAQSAMRTIEVSYDNIKVYKDNVLCELKDSNGSIIEPFIYDGTTYMPVRGTANLADMQVTWDGNTKSVYLWDKMVPSGTFLTDVCPPYKNDGDLYLSSEGEHFVMAGKKYSNGITLYNGAVALFNLDSKFSTIECTVGHIDGAYPADSETISFIVDGRTVKEIEFEKEEMPKQISVPVNYGLQMKIVAGSDNWGRIGIGNITVQ